MTTLLLHTIKEKIDDFVLNSPQNIVNELEMMRMYDQPLVAVAGAHDALWEKLKEPEVVGSQHLSPQEWLVGAKSVISYFLPYTQRIRRSNCSEGFPSAEWLYGRYEGEMFNNALCGFVVEMIERAGGRAIAPSIDKRLAVVNRRSNWSERHVAFIAGLGTFSLNRSMITSLGSAGRFGSVIVDFASAPTKRLYKEVDEYCTKCGACIDRCPPRAINENGKDNGICLHFLDEVLERYKPRYGCGKCQTAVPCEDKNPKEKV
ncbi:MAG: 4Fe-4S binding protein [Desulfotomaculaceae bacterium]|nr:4Fe-4S binding protein [Desulfotomaculaceae bacterium]